jgi:hypothetical protein
VIRAVFCKVTDLSKLKLVQIGPVAKSNDDCAASSSHQMSSTRSLISQVVIKEGRLKCEIIPLRYF